MAGSLRIQTLEENPSLKKAARVIEHASWGGLEFLNYTRPHYDFYEEVCDRFPDYQMCLVDDEHEYPLAVATCAPMAWDEADGLPDEGWDWVLRTAANDAAGPRKFLGGFQISVPAIHRGKGYARMMIGAFVNKSRTKGLGGFLAAVRPSHKHEYPDVPIEEYITWKDGRGRVFDPWLRNHMASGGQYVRPCKRSMVVKEPVDFWETWTKRRFESSGSYFVKGALAPVSIDLEAQTGCYEEPNVWFVYPT